tara:strand:+ start:1046 stop:1261 length:216 start_codon:yes stop_codon:yes gene_type:complete
VENVVATMEIPSSHQGIFLPERKYSVELLEDFFETKNPITKVDRKKQKIIAKSNVDKSIMKILFLKIIYYK